MPTVLFIDGWRFFFYSNEGTEPMHIHAEKGSGECKFWLLPDTYEIEEEYAYGMSPSDRREVRRILLIHLDPLAAAWRNHFGAQS